jgi:hypothetical protein
MARHELDELTRIDRLREYPSIPAARQRASSPFIA